MTHPHDDSKILVVGGGSMGRRRIRDASALRPGRVALFEPMPERCREVAEGYGIEGYTNIDEALAQQPRIMVISTPPALHDTYIQLAMDRQMHVFAELPFAFDRDMLERVAERADTYPAVLGVSATIRFYPPFRILRDLIEQGTVGRPLYFEYSLGNYLPDWHPHEDYRKFYAKGDPRQGGSGVDMILHEMLAIQWLIGPIQSLCGRIAKCSDLEVEGGDSHDALVSFEGGCRGYFHHDIIEQGTRGRHIRVVADGGTIEWHQHEPTIRVYDGGAKAERHIPFDKAADWDEAMRASRDMHEILSATTVASGAIPGGDQAGFTYESCYLREMQHFLDAADGKHPYTLATIQEELHNVRLFHTLLDVAETAREAPVGAETCQLNPTL